MNIQLPPLDNATLSRFPSALDQREAQLHEALKTIKHYEEKPFYTRNLFENDSEMVGKDFSTITEDEFVDLFEYGINCKCQCCAEIRYILLLRSKLVADEVCIKEFEEALKSIANPPDSTVSCVCFCKHDNEMCCALNDHYCEQCIAAQVLKKV